MDKEPEWLADSRLVPQSYRSPRACGIWLECGGCQRNDVIVGSNTDEWAARPNADAARVFRKHGWTGSGDNMTGQLCPSCSAQAKAA